MPDGRDRGGVMGGNLGFGLRHASERLVPSRLQFASHQSVCRVGSVVLPEGAIGCIARRFEITPERLTHLVPLLPRLLLGSNGRRNSARANDSEKGTLNGVIHPQPAKSDATRLAIVHPAAGAAVARDVMLRSRVAEGQFTPAHRRADDEFAAAGLLVTGGERTLPQQVKLILVETSFEAEQKPIVAMTRRIDRLLIDQHGIDHAAHLDQLLPVPAVAGEPRDLARGNGANFAEADLRHHPLKTGALDAACSGTAKIIIDHLDLGPAKCSQAIAHGVLQRAAFPVVQNLMSRRLANVEDRFAIQMLGADLVRDHDRPSSNPSGACRHSPGSASLSGWLAPPASPWVVRTRPACRRWSARSLRTGRFPDSGRQGQVIRSNRWHPML